LSGNLDTDSEVPTGLFAFSQANAGATVPFEFVPNTAAGTSAAGEMIIDPLEFGADEFGAPMDSDFEFTIIGQPTWTYPTVP
jgi:hypothetical protein